MTNKFTVIEEIGRGGFGVVEKVKDANGTLFARKTFQPAPYIPYLSYEQLRLRFRREVKTQAELGGREIMPVFEYSLDSDSPWFVMPLAEKSYDQQLKEDKLTGKLGIDAIADILNSLEYLHDHDFVHRDLNPKNILLHEGNWKLSDLGAVLPPSGHTVTLTEGTVIYTEQYCSPEQRNDFHKTRPSADIFSFGCILHDIFGKLPRIPYSQQSADGPVGIIIEKCTEMTPGRRPSVRVLRPMLLETLVEIGGYCKVADQKSEEWLQRFNSIEQWSEEEFDNFARFFAQLDVNERVPGHENDWVYTLSTPFLTRIPAEALEKIIERDDGVADAIVEKYCFWAQSTAFLFHYVDIVCTRLTAIFDNGKASHKALALIALIRLATSHNRYYVMRQLLQRCSSTLKKETARRLSIEIKTEELERKFRDCIDLVDWDKDLLAPELKSLLP